MDNTITKGMKVLVVESPVIPPFSRDDEMKKLIGKVGTVTGRQLGDYLEVRILAPEFSPKPFGFLLYPHQLKIVQW